MPIDSSLDAYYLQQSEPNQSCLLAMRTLILAQDEQVSECRKWGMPCFCYRKKMFCYLWKDKKSNEPYILFVEGKHLDHPKLEVGKRSRMKIFRLAPHEDLPTKIIEKLLQESLNLYRNGVIKTK